MPVAADLVVAAGDMGSKARDRVVFTVMHDGTTVMRAKTKSIKNLKGMLKRPGKRVPMSDMRHL